MTTAATSFLPPDSYVAPTAEQATAAGGRPETALGLPDSPGFRPSMNARRGFDLDDIYAVGETSVRSSLPK